MLYRVHKGAGGLEPVGTTTTTDEALLEVDFEDWVERRPELLGEDLLVVGRQVTVDDGKDRIDLLALDTNANLVVIELKRDLVGGDVDLQALRYAAMVSGWSEEVVRGLAEDYWHASGQSRAAFTKELDAFCDADYEVNERQRVVIAGRHVHPRVATMALWLRSSGIDVRVLGMDLYRDGDSLYVAPRVVIPLPTETDVAATPQPTAAAKEWHRDGPSWHLDQQLSETGREILLRLVDLVAEHVPDADGPRWQQKNYLRWGPGGRTWMRAYTDNANQIALMLYGVGDQSPKDLATKLGLPTQTEAASHDVSRVNKGKRDTQMWIVFKGLDDLLGAEAALGGVLTDTWERYLSEA